MTKEIRLTIAMDVNVIWRIIQTQFTPALLKQPGSKLIQVAPPRQPLVRGARRLVNHAVDSSLFERVMRLVSRLHQRILGGSQPEEQQMHYLFVRRGIRHHAAVSGLRIHIPDGPAERSDIRKPVEMPH